MTLESTVAREAFVGNGVTKSFNFSFRVWDVTQILVYRAVTNAEVDITSECEIELVDDGEGGGIVTFDTAPASGDSIAIVRNMPFIQEDRYINGSRFDPHEIEDRFDQDCAERQQLLEGVTRAVKVPYTDDRTSEEYAYDFWTAVDETLENRDIACNCRKVACECAASALEDADRAEQAAILATHAENIDRTWTVEEDIPAGTQITLPVWYYPTRNILRLSIDGTEMYLGAQFEEVGDDPDLLTTQVVVLFDILAGQQMHAWVVMSNVAAYAKRTIRRLEKAASEMEATKEDVTQAIEEKLEASESEIDRKLDASEAEIDRKVEEAESEIDEKLAEADATIQANLDRAQSCMEDSCECATSAQRSQEQSANSASEAGESADRADDAATDASRAAHDARRYARCAYIYRSGKSLAAILEEDFIYNVPSGFYVINGEMVIPATVQHSIMPVPTEDSIPRTCDGFFVLAPGFTDPRPCPPPHRRWEDDDDSEEDEDTSTDTSPTPPATASRWANMTPCGQRHRYSTR